MLEVFGWGALIVFVLFIIKELGDKYPIGCLLASVVFIILFVKTCHDMNKEDEERRVLTEQREEKLRQELKETEYMRTEEHQKMEYQKKYWHKK